MMGRCHLRCKNRTLLLCSVSLLRVGDKFRVFYWIHFILFYLFYAIASVYHQLVNGETVSNMMVRDDTVSFKNVATKINAHKKGINLLKTAIKSTKNYLISSSADKTIKIWDTDLYLNISKLI